MNKGEGAGRRGGANPTSKQNIEHNNEPIARVRNDRSVAVRRGVVKRPLAFAVFASTFAAFRLSFGVLALAAAAIVD